MSNPSIRVVIVSHGEQSKGMLNTVQMLLGPQENIAAYSLYPEQTTNDLIAVLEKEIHQKSILSRHWLGISLNKQGSMPLPALSEQPMAST